MRLFDDLLAGIPQAAYRLPDNQATGILLTPVLDDHVRNYLAAGGRVILLQNGAGPLPARRLPFWREAIKLFSSHAFWQHFPRPTFAGYQFLPLATDVAFEIAKLPVALPGVEDVRPIMQRLDAREFHLTHYLLEARAGRGVLLACSLRLGGGYGVQPDGLVRNAAGQALLHAMAQHLAAA